jgi:hypothetical protein
MRHLTEKTMDLSFKFPFTCIVAGPTRSGKTEWTKKLVRAAKEMISPAPDRIIWAYGEWQDSYEELKKIPNLELVEGIPDIAPLKQNKQEKKLVVCDDLMQALGKEKNTDLVSLFVRGSHHWNVGIIHIVQNLFYANMRTARINSHYLVLLKNPSDRLQVMTLARQLYPHKYKSFLEAFEDACSERYGYLLIDNEPSTDDSLRLRSHIFPGENCVVYIPK